MCRPFSHCWKVQQLWCLEQAANLGGCLQNAPRCACKPPPAAPTHLSSSPSSLAACCTSSWGRAAQVGARVEPGRIVQGPGGAGGAWGLAHTD